MRLIIFILYSILITTESSKCPESRKPHSTSCTIFYSCVNLPSGGYVWVPSKCTEGLIFQPYLRMCVLPGDSWTCDTLLTESSYITKRYDNPELLDPNETSYMGSTEDPLNFSELIDSSYTTDSIPYESDQEVATPYPLIEFEETTENNTDNASTTNTDSMLNKLIHHLLIYKEITIPLEFLASSLSTTPSRPASNLPLSSYLIQNYIQQNNNLQSTIITGAKLQNVTEDSVPLMKNVASKLNTSVSNKENSSDTSQTAFDTIDENNNIILISDNVGNKQYLTVEKYKSLGYRLDSQFVHVIPCIKNIRMPNVTDCTRYYICEPQMASVIEYLCPLYTAFNKYAKTCDTETYNKCIENRKKEVNSSDLENVLQLNMPNKNICTEHGKMKDPTSETRYYICYSAGGDLQSFKSIRMTCPNSLIFCQTKKVCTTKRLCKTT